MLYAFVLISQLIYVFFQLETFLGILSADVVFQLVRGFHFREQKFQQIWSVFAKNERYFDTKILRMAMSTRYVAESI